MKSKKIVCILYSIVLIGMNVFGFAIFSDYRMTDKIFHKRVVEVQARQQELVNVSEVHKELLKFANQYHVTIMKYEFLNEKRIIYLYDKSTRSFKYEVSVYHMENKCVSI